MVPILNTDENQRGRESTWFLPFTVLTMRQGNSGIDRMSRLYGAIARKCDAVGKNHFRYDGESTIHASFCDSRAVSGRQRSLFQSCLTNTLSSGYVTLGADICGVVTTSSHVWPDGIKFYEPLCIAISRRRRNGTDNSPYQRNFYLASVLVLKRFFELDCIFKKLGDSFRGSATKMFS